MITKPGETVTVDFTTQTAATGALTDADSLPTGTVSKNGTDDGTVTVTVTNKATGRYKASFTVPVSYVAGDEVDLYIAATVATIAGGGVVWRTTIDTSRVSDVPDGVWDELLTGATHNIATSAGRRLRQLEDPVGGTVDDASATTTQFNTSLSGYANDHFNDQIVYFITGNLAGQVRPILDFAGTGGAITLSEALTEAPANGDAFDILPQHVHPVSQIQSGLATAVAVAAVKADTAATLEDTGTTLPTAVAAVQTEVNKVPRTGETHTWTNTSTSETATVEITEP